MTSYVALIRGLNVGGNNKVSMAELKEIMNDLNYQNVSTIGNTGVLFFDSDNEVNDNKLENRLTEKLKVEIQLVTHTFEHLLEVKKMLPDWWDKNSDWRHNAAFMLDDFDTMKLKEDLKTMDSLIEKGIFIDDILFWSSSFADRKAYYQSEYHKLLKKQVYKHMTIRNANTLNKIFEKIENN